MKAEAIPLVLDPRAARMHARVAEWIAGGGDLCGVALEDVQRTVARAAGLLVRDLEAQEVAKVAREFIAAEVDRREQAEAQASIASARAEEDERTRLDYLAKRAADYKLLQGEYGLPPRRFVQSGPGKGYREIPPGEPKR